jgi:tetratricopeptide (TPR) repeat protein
VNMGIALDALNRHRDAIACYKEALEINPYSVAALSNKATSLAASGYFHLAIANCNQALELQEALSHAWQVKSLCLIELGRDGDALEGLLRATELDSSRAHAWLSRGDLEASLGMFDEANNSWGRACEASGGRDKALEEQVRQRFDEFRRATPNGAISVLPCSPTSLLAWQPAEPKMRPPLPRTRTTTA